MGRALKTGHRVLTTWHALDGADAIDRAASELSTIGGNSLENARSLANSVDIIVAQQKLGDGSRRVMSVEELTGELKDGRAVTKKLFEFVLTGKADKDPETGKVTKIYGYFQQSNPISEKLVQLFYSVGITREELDEFINIPEVIAGETNLPSQRGIVESTVKEVSISSESVRVDTSSSDLSSIDGVDDNDLSFL